MVDFDALEAAGIDDAHGRARLIEYLDTLGFTAEEMVEANSRGRLVGLAGDVLQRPGRPIYSVRAAGEALGVPAEQVAQAWTLLGLTVEDADLAMLSQADVDALATWFEMKALVGASGASGFLRALGSATARVAEAESAAIRAGAPDIQLHHTGDELASAQAYRAVSELVPRIGELLHVAHGHHMIRARSHFRRVLRDSSASVLCGIGFADLSGFTELTRRLTATELSSVLNEFGAVVSGVMHAGDGRVVKFIGDEVMWVSATPEALVQTAADLVDHPTARAAGPVRAGLNYGDTLAINGDYFGNTVNLAARLAAAAKPGQILAAQALREELPNWPATMCDPLTLKGFDDPVTAYELHRCS
jgi:class 3 adenylate cyclase